MFSCCFSAYNKVSKRDRKDSGGKIFRTCVIFYWTRHGDWYADRRQCDPDHRCGGLPDVRIPSVLSLTGMWESETPAYLFFVWVKK